MRIIYSGILYDIEITSDDLKEFLYKKAKNEYFIDFDMDFYSRAIGEKLLFSIKFGRGDDLSLHQYHFYTYLLKMRIDEEELKLDTISKGYLIDNSITVDKLYENVEIFISPIKLLREYFDCCSDDIIKILEFNIFSVRYSTMTVEHIHQI